MDIKVVSGATLGEAITALGDVACDFASVHANCEITIAPETISSMPAAFHGSTSCLGAMTHEGATRGVAIFCIADPDGAYGTGLSDFAEGPRHAAASATQQALMAADRLGERPELVWVAATPGAEEDVVEGIQDVVGADIPVIGGSAADNSVEGNWFVFDGTDTLGEGVIVSVLFPSRPLSFAYQNGYSPTAHKGTVTQADGRTIREIDGKPAMDVYADWTENAVTTVPRGAGAKAILGDSTLWPLGREISQLGQVPFYLLAH
ncbi:MAG: FIST N-terminal domain-containing protein, partial [Pseudomonadota bacterium]